MLTKPYTAAPYYPPSPIGDETVRVRPIRAYFQSRGYTCGFACTLTVLHAFHRLVEPRHLYQRLGTDSEGTSQTSIIRELRAASLSVNVRYDHSFESMKRAIDAGKLIIGYHHGVEHWVVLYGYGLGPERIFVADPVREWRKEHLWDNYGSKLRGFGIVCAERTRKRSLPEKAVSAVATL